MQIFVDSFDVLFSIPTLSGGMACFFLCVLLGKILINQTYVQIPEHIYRKATASMHIDDLVSEKLQIKRGVRQGDPISPKLFSAAIETIFQAVDLDKGLNIDGETLTNLRFADDVALTTNNITEMEEQLNRLT